MVAPLAEVTNLATRLHHLHHFPHCNALSWITKLALSVGIELVSSSARVTSVIKIIRRVCILTFTIRGLASQQTQPITIAILTEQCYTLFFVFFVFPLNLMLAFNLGLLPGSCLNFENLIQASSFLLHPYINVIFNLNTKYLTLSHHVISKHCRSARLP